MNPLVSVIIPVYKVEKFLDRCIESVVGQTYRNLEIILVDDGSPDNCPAMCDAWAERDSRINVLHKENTGVSDSRNRAIDISTGEYLFFVDSDDMITPNAVEVLYYAIESEQADLAVSTEYYSFAEGTQFETSSVKCLYSFGSGQALEKMYCEIKRWEIWGTLYRKSCFKSVRFPVDKVIAEDMYVVTQIVLGAKNITFVDTKVYCYYSHSDSVMRADNRNFVVKYDLFEVTKEIVEQMKTNLRAPYLKNAIAGILEELLSRVHLACSNRSENEDFIYPSKRLARQNIKYILFSNKISLKRKIFMFLVLCGVSHKIFK